MACNYPEDNYLKIVISFSEQTPGAREEDKVIFGKVVAPFPDYKSFFDHLGVFGATLRHEIQQKRILASIDKRFGLNKSKMCTLIIAEDWVLRMDVEGKFKNKKVKGGSMVYTDRNKFNIKKALTKFSEELVDEESVIYEYLRGDKIWE